MKEVQKLVTGDPFENFYKQLEEVKDFHRRYPNEPVENLERVYKRQRPAEGEIIRSETDNMFTGEESNGRFFDLTPLHEDYLNLPGVKRLTYIQYLDHFDHFTPPQLPLKRQQKLSGSYFKYVSDLDSYLERFLQRTRPLEDFDKFFSTIDQDFEKAWSSGGLPGWGEDSKASTADGPETEGSGSGIWCPDCEKEFTNPNVYKSHLTGKKHLKAIEAKKSSDAPAKPQPGSHQTANINHLKERAIATHEHRIRAFAKYLLNERSNTRVNVERKAGMTERERQAELDALFAEDDSAAAAAAGASRADNSGSDNDDEERIYNPLKLPLAWDGKPIPYWLYKLHGLGVEFYCEICGNFVFMGRRAFDKHFSEARHVYGLKCLGISGPGAGGGLFREITGIDEAVMLWEKIKRERAEKERKEEAVVQMEDGEGNVMPERIYRDLQKQGIL